MNFNQNFQGPEREWGVCPTCKGMSEVPCPKCNGRGEVFDRIGGKAYRCGNCGGSGKASCPNPQCQGGMVPRM